MDANQVRLILKKAIGKNSHAWARAHGVSQPLVSLTTTGRREPSKSILDALGLERVVSYRRKTQPEKTDGQAS